MGDFSTWTEASRVQLSVSSTAVKKLGFTSLCVMYLHGVVEFRESFTFFLIHFVCMCLMFVIRVTDTSLSVCVGLER